MNTTELGALSTAERVTKLIEVSNELAVRLNHQEKTAAAAEASRQQLIPVVADACIKAGAAKTEQRATVLARLDNHVETLNMMYKLAEMLSNAKSDKSPAAIGQPAEKKASAHTADDAALDKMLAAIRSYKRS